MKKRSDWDFSNHTHKVEIFKSENNNEVRIDHFRNGDSEMGYIRFVNDDYGMTVYGDFGNWVFCRPFHPSPDGYVSEHYWIEKLQISSCQEPYTYDGEETAKEIQKLIDNGLEEYGYEGDDLEKMKEWYNDLLDYTEDEIEYKYHAYRDSFSPDFDYEDIPYCKELSVQLKIIFDAFDEICKKMKDNNIKK